MIDLQQRGQGLDGYPLLVAQLQALLETGRRYLHDTIERAPALESPMAVRRYLKSMLRHEPSEVFGCLFLDSKHRPLAFEILFRGTIDRASVYPREVVRRSLVHNAAALLHAINVTRSEALAAFGIAVLFARFLTEPLFGLIARAGTTEVYTATALFIALAAGWATGMAGLSLTLGAFLGGMAVADSRYRILVQTEIDAFRGLFLSFFFISVGLSIDPALLVADWMLVVGVTLGMIVLKCAFNVVAALLNRWSVPGSIQLGFLLGQGSEFTLVLLALPAVAGLAEPRLVSAMVTGGYELVLHAVPRDAFLERVGCLVVEFVFSQS